MADFEIIASSIALNKKQSLKDIYEAAVSGADRVELRLDYWSKPRPSTEDIRDLAYYFYPSVLKLLTIRHKSQADPSDKRSGFKGEESERIPLLMYAMINMPVYVDLEESLSDTFPLVRGEKTIMSHHNFHSTPENLEEICATITNKLKGKGNVKIATKAKSYDDVLRMLKLVYEKKITGICMGREGVLTRILGPIYGAPFTYGALGEGRTSAPGQLTVPMLKEKIELASRYYNEGKILPPSQLTAAHLEEYSKLLKL